MAKNKTKKSKENKGPNKFVQFWKNFGQWFVDFGKRFVDGSIGTKLSHFVMGAGSFYHHQWIKGNI